MIWIRRCWADNGISYAQGCSWQDQCVLCTLGNPVPGLYPLLCKMSLTTCGFLCYLDSGVKMKSPVTQMQMQIAPIYFYICQLSSSDLWSKQLSHPSFMGSLMWHDPEMSFVLIHATMLKEGNLHMSLVRETLGFFFFCTI